VIASRTGGLAEVIRHGVDGLLVENRAETIADAIRDLYGNPARAQALGQTARQSVIDRFTEDRMVRHTLNVYQQVLN
jgi:starch synthase